MDNIILSLSNQISNIKDSEKFFSILIENMPPQLQNIKQGDSLLLDILQVIQKDNSTIKLSTLFVSDDNVVSEIPIKLSAPKAVIENINKFPPEKLELKIVNAQQNQSTAKIVSINSVSVDEFLKSINTKENKAGENPAVVSQSTKYPKLEPLIVKLSNPSNMSQVQNIKINVQIANFEPTQDIISTINKETQPILSNIKQEILLYSQENRPTPNIKQSFLSLQNKFILGEMKLDKGVNFISTQIGNIFPENQDIKIPVGAKIVLLVKDISDTTSKIKLSEVLPEFSRLINIEPITSQKLSNTPLLQKILAPLKNIPQATNYTSEILQKIPTFDDNMLLNIVNFMKSATQKDLTPWIGEKLISNLKNIGDRGQEVINTLQEIVMSSTEKNIQTWRIIEIPFYNGETISKIRISTKQREKDDNNETTPKSQGTRFVVDTSFSKLGDFQFDGFTIAKDRRFDLIIRTSKKIDEDIYTNIISLYKTSLSNVNYHGNINVNVKENFIKICDDNSKSGILNDGVYI